MPPLDLDKGGRRPQIIKTNLGPTAGWKMTDAPTYVEYTIGGGGDAIAPGYKGGLLIPDWLHVAGWFISSPSPGTCVVDVWRLSYESYLAQNVPTVANSIAGTDKPRLSNQVAAASTALTGWVTLINQNDYVAFNVDSNNVVSLITVVLLCVREIGPS